MINLRAFVRGIFAGIAIAIGGIVYSLLSFLLRDAMTDTLRLLPSVLFSVGLILVCFLRLLLCTGKAGFLFNPLLLRHDKGTARRDALDFAFSIPGNIVGALVIGLLFGLLAKAIPGFSEYLGSLAEGKLLGDQFSSYFKAFMQAVACGFFVFLAVYLFRLFKNVGLQLLGIALSIGAFVYLGLQHCVANVFYFAASLTFEPRMLLYFVVVMLGNFLGALLTCFLAIALALLSKSKRLERAL